MAINLIRVDPSPSLLPLAALLVLGAGGTAANAQQGQEPPMGIPLECRLGQQAWQRCRMDVEQVGVTWALLVGEHRLEFHHDGRGVTNMQGAVGAWRTVSARWDSQGNLCWDGVCARGAIPLD